jgi:hypothetical protein
MLEALSGAVKDYVDRCHQQVVDHVIPLEEKASSLDAAIVVRFAALEARIVDLEARLEAREAEKVE